MALDQDQLDFFHANGYLRVGRILDDELLQTLRREYDAEFQKAWESNAYRNLAIDDGGDSTAKQTADRRMYQIINMGARNLHFRRLYYHAPLLDLITDLIGPNIQLFHDQALYKPARHGGAVYWHQDNGYWRCRPANLVSVWITLDDAYEANGAMQVLPGSHLRPVWHDKSTATNALKQVDVGDTSGRVVVDLKAGECMIHHCQTLHYTQPNDTDDDRRAFILHYMTPGTRQADAEKPMAVDWGHPLLRAAIG